MKQLHANEEAEECDPQARAQRHEKWWDVVTAA